MTTIFCSAAEPDTAAVNVSCSGVVRIGSSLTSILVGFCQAATEQLEQENRQLRAEVERLKEKLVALDIRGGGEDQCIQWCHYFGQHNRAQPCDEDSPLPVAQIPTSTPASAVPLPPNAEGPPEPKESPNKHMEQPPPRETRVKEKGKKEREKKEKATSQG